jgi:hypothetical protein
MVSDGTASRDEAQQVWDTEACLARAQAVVLAVTMAANTLQRSDVPTELRERAKQKIVAAWTALEGHSVGTANRRRLLGAVNQAARTTEVGVAAGNSVLALLPPDLLMLLLPHADALGQVVETWRQWKPGRRRGDTPGKWDALAALWALATGEATTPDAWEKTWKDAEATRKKRREEAVKRAASYVAAQRVEETGK